MRGLTWHLGPRGVRVVDLLEPVDDNNNNNNKGQLLRGFVCLDHSTYCLRSRRV